MRSKLPIRLLSKIILSTPDLIPFFARSLYRKHKGADKDYKMGDGRALKLPYQISLRITNACNHRCAVCGQYGENGYMLNKAEHGDLLTTLPMEKYKEIVDEFADKKPLFYVTGGEPFLYRGFMPLMNYIKEKGCLLNVVTNGVKLKESAEEIVRNGWDMILVSLDGPEEIHDQCRGIKGAYRTTVDGLKDLVKWKRKLGKKKPYIVTSTTLSDVNIDYIDQTFEIGREIELDIMVVYLSWFTNDEIGKAQEKIFQEKLGVKAYTWKSYSREFSEETAQKFADNLERLTSKKWPFEYMVIPNLKNKEEIKRYYLDASELFGFSKCVAPFLMTDIMPNGDVVTCRDFIDVKVGNITQNKLSEIWNNEKYVQFRKLLIDNGGLLPQCSRCCGLMGF